MMNARMTVLTILGCALVFGRGEPGRAQEAKTMSKSDMSMTAPSVPVCGVNSPEASLEIANDTGETTMTDKIARTDDEWRRLLDEETYRITRQKGTERAFSGKYWKTKTPGMYKCAACGAPLFDSDTKFESGTGWPSFYQPASPDSVETHDDRSYGMARTEVVCKRCGAHLGHVFDDGPQPTGERFCINSAALKLEERKPAAAAPAESKSKDVAK